MPQRPAWFVAVLLSMLAVLMIAHLAMLWVGVLDCDAYARILLERAAGDPGLIVTDDNRECALVEETFSEAVGQYLAVILSLLGGAAISGGVAVAKRPPDDVR